MKSPNYASGDKQIVEVVPQNTVGTGLMSSSDDAAICIYQCNFGHIVRSDNYQIARITDMSNMRSGRAVSTILTIVLLIAKTGTLTHAYEHDPVSPRDKVCSTCIAGQALGSACVESTPQFETAIYKSVSPGQRVSTVAAVHFSLARQRAPPTPL